MTTINYQQLKLQFAQLIKDLGQKVTVSKLNGKRTNTYGVIGYIEGLEIQTADQVSSTLGDHKTIYLPGTLTASQAPEVNDNILTKTESHQIVEVIEYNPAGITVAWKVKVRG